MVTNQKPTGRASSIPSGLAIGAAVSLSITLSAAAIMGKLIDSEKMHWENVGYGIIVILLLSAFTGSVVSYAKIKRQRLMICMLSGVVYFGVLLSITALFFGGQYQAVGVTALLILAGSGTAGLLGIKEERGKRGRKNRHHYR